jgi:hypothetical protein
LARDRRSALSASRFYFPKSISENANAAARLLLELFHLARSRDATDVEIKINR